MKTIHAAQALLADGWATDVSVDIHDDGRIAQVRQADQLQHTDKAAASNDNTRSNETNVQILLPAPVNLHSHAFQRAMAGLTERRGPDPTDSFWTWRHLMYRFLEHLTPSDIEAITAFAQMQMLESGYAVNVEFHYLHHQPGGTEYDNPAELSERVIAATHTSGIGLTLLPVHYQYGGCDKRAASGGQLRFASDSAGYARLWLKARDALNSLPNDTRLGVAPHSLRAVAPESLQDLLQVAPSDPFHMHIAEQQAEVNEFEAHWGARPVQWLLDNVPVDQRWCLIHCTQMDDRETQALAGSGAVAGLCPITESSLGDGIFNGVEFINAGGRLGIGTDSNIRISLTEELRTLEYSQRLRDHSRAAMANTELSTGRRLFDAVLSGGAQAAGRQTGRIETGCWADLMALDGQQVDLQNSHGDLLLDTFVFAGDDSMIKEVWSAGRHLVTAGRHIKRDDIECEYRKVVKHLRAAL
jgi:formimidoylglutamate deiminase